MRRTFQYYIGVYVTIFLSGCSLPAGFSAASWAIDGASYIATKKSLTDHGISFVAGQDCALYRFITNMNICQNYDDLAFSVMKIAEASKLIENQIFINRLDEIYYGFDMHVKVENVVVNDKLKFIQDNALIAVKNDD